MRRFGLDADGRRLAGRWRGAIAWGVGVLGVAVLVVGCGRQPAAAPVDELAVLPIGGELDLQGPGGTTVRLADDQEHVRVLFFGYTSCPDACPTALARLARVHRLLEAAGKGDVLRLVYVSVDPERDTPESATAYLEFFQLPGVGVTGPEERLRAVAKAYGAFFERHQSESKLGVLYDHTTTLYLLDRRGQVRRLIRTEDPPEAIAGWISMLATDSGRDR